MTVLKCLAAAAALAFWAQIAMACDDFAEEMTLAAAQEAAKVAQANQTTERQTAGLASSTPTDVASVQETSLQPEASAAVQR